MKTNKEMWAVQHVPSGSWDRGDQQLILYPFEHEARFCCPNDAFRPIKVVVRVAEEKALGRRRT